MAPWINETVEESYYTLILCCFFICEINKLVTNNKKHLNSYICQIGCPNYQITAIVSFIFRSVREGEGWFEVDCTWLIHYKKKTDNHPAVLLNLFTIHHSVITIFFPNIAFHFLTTIKLIYILVYIYINLWTVISSLLPELWIFLKLWAIIGI